jgi:hypothetical protein
MDNGGLVGDPNNSFGVESVLIYAPRRFGLVTPMSGEPDE